MANANNKSDKNSLLSFVSKGKSEPPPSTSTSTVPFQSSLTFNSMDNFLSDSSSLYSEIWWCVRTAVNNYSASYNGDIDFHLKQMFPMYKLCKSFLVDRRNQHMIHFDCFKCFRIYWQFYDQFCWRGGSFYLWIGVLKKILGTWNF